MPLAKISGPSRDKNKLFFITFEKKTGNSWDSWCSREWLKWKSDYIFELPNKELWSTTRFSSNFHQVAAESNMIEIEKNELIRTKMCVRSLDFEEREQIRQGFIFHNIKGDMISLISLIHTFVNLPALLLKNTLRFLIRAGRLTKVWIGDIISLISHKTFC